MLVTFSSDAYADITLFGDVAEHMLNMMGHSGAVPGAILAEDVPEALERLRRGVADQMALAVEDVDRDEDDEEHVSLSHRALPLIDLLEAAARENSNVMWHKG